jgi:hypothetical protein
METVGTIDRKRFKTATIFYFVFVFVFVVLNSLGFILFSLVKSGNEYSFGEYCLMPLIFLIPFFVIFLINSKNPWLFISICFLGIVFGFYRYNENIFAADGVFLLFDGCFHLGMFIYQILPRPHFNYEEPLFISIFEFIQFISVFFTTRKIVSKIKL